MSSEEFDKKVIGEFTAEALGISQEEFYAGLIYVLKKVSIHLADMELSPETQVMQVSILKISKILKSQPEMLRKIESGKN